MLYIPVNYSMHHNYYLNHLIYKFPSKVGKKCWGTSYVSYYSWKSQSSKNKQRIKKEDQLRKFRLTNFSVVLSFHLKRINGELKENNIGGTWTTLPKKRKKEEKLESTNNNRKNDSNSISIYKVQCLNLDR